MNLSSNWGALMDLSSDWGALMDMCSNWVVTWWFGLSPVLLLILILLLFWVLKDQGACNFEKLKYSIPPLNHNFSTSTPACKHSLYKPRTWWVKFIVEYVLTVTWKRLNTETTEHGIGSKICGNPLKVGFLDVSAISSNFSEIPL